MTDTMIADLIVHQIVDSLTAAMKTAIAIDDPTYVSNIQAYRFQEDPIVAQNNIYVSTGDPDNPNYTDGLINSKGMENLGLRVPAGEIGGGHLWWRRGRARLGCFFILENCTQTEAGTYAHNILGRAMKTIESTSVNFLVDTFGERGHSKVRVHSSTFHESGGPPTSYIWRGDIFWQALTQRPL
jgi:hypothetical protein